MTDKKGFGFGNPGQNLRTMQNREPYSTMEFHVLRGLLLACNNAGQCERACLFFCKAMDRWPAAVREHYVAKGKRLDATAVKKCQNMLYRRLWGAVVAYPGNVANTDIITQDYTREGLPVTYGEARVFIKPWATTALKKCTIETLAMVLGRKSTDVIKRIAPAVFSVRGTFGMPDPTANHNVLREIIHELVRTDLGNKETFTQALSAYRRFQAIVMGE